MDFGITKIAVYNGVNSVEGRIENIKRWYKYIYT